MLSQWGGKSWSGSPAVGEGSDLISLPYEESDPDGRREGRCVDYCARGEEGA